MVRDIIRDYKKAIQNSNMKKDFYTWLKEQKHRDDPIGDLAQDYIRDPWGFWKAPSDIVEEAETEYNAIT